MKIIKRNGAEVPFDITKIITAVTKASDSVGGQSRLTREQITQIAAAVTDQCQALNRAVNVEEVQDMVENQLMDIQAHDVARHYITYRYVQSLKRQTNTTDERILSLIECQNEEVKQENANKNPTVNSVQRDYMAGEISKDLTARLLLDPEIVKAHQEGLIHFHDSDYFAQHMHNCDLVNLEDMLQNGTVISGTYIEKPHSFSTACNIATQIIAQVASNQYGGQSISLTHLAPFVDVSRKKIAAEVELEMEGLDVSAERKKEIVERRLRNEINRGVQTIQYQVVTLMTTNGQAPFITVFMYLGEARNPQEKADLAIIIEETIRQRYQGVKNEAGVWITPAFPKLIYVLEADNIRPGTPYYYLTELAAKCTAKRMVPDYISEKKMLELKVDKNGEGHCYTCMGCRSFLTPYVDPETGKPKYYGRFNQGVVTINLVDVALSSGGNFEKFWKIFDERLDLCHRALQARHKRLLGTPSDAAPILWQYGALARLKKGEKIDKLLFGGYSTISLGYAGLYECVKYMTGKSHTDAGAKPFALSVMQHMNDKCNAWKKAENMDYSLYGTPLESTTYKFAKCLQKRFGIVKGITDKNYITNSYHVHVSEPIDAFTKLKFEADFQRLSPGGAISYVEVPNMQDNLEAVMSVLQFIYDNIMYAELNTKSDYCQVCGYDGEIKIVEDDGKLVWECPKCGNRDQNKLNVALAFVLRGGLGEDGLFELCAALLERGKRSEHALDARKARVRLDGEGLCDAHVLRPALREVAVRAFAGKKFDANAVAELLHGEELDESHLTGTHDVRAAAGAAVRAGEGDDAHVALERLFAAVLDLVELRAAIELDVDGVILIDVQVGELFNLHKFIPRNVGVEVDRDDVRAHVEADVVAVEALADEARADVLARMLLHVVKAARPVDLAGDALSHFKGLVTKVRDDAVFLVDLEHVRLAQNAGVIRLAAALGVEGRLREHNGVAALDSVAGDDGGGKALLKGIFIVEFSCFHGVLL
mgnify:CR=1 FL=1